ncbi:MerR family transcriptional regulator [Kitasatospora nipponensis]|uniref:MerR family transcriptional regulator n=1 Tax=Kitasatospora nipponensis TaxID=258049 RepID=A0ABN1WW01_9ACTN
MFTIGDFARHGRVSVRMLRHYDAIGLLRPAHVDPATGYRSYRAGQLARLNRVVALKELGFTLQQVQTILDEQVGVEELRGMLRLRRAELAEAMAEAAARLTQVEARLRTIESEGRMDTNDVVLKRIAAVRVARLSATVAGYDPQDISPVMGPLFDRLCRQVEAAGLTGTGAIAYYESTGDGSGGVLAHAAVPLAAGAGTELRTGADGTVDGADFSIVDLPAIEAATIVHRGSMDDVMPTVQALAGWIDASGYRSVGLSRELYLECPADRSQWVTELQEPVGAV